MQFFSPVPVHRSILVVGTIVRTQPKKSVMCKRISVLKFIRIWTSFYDRVPLGRHFYDGTSLAECAHFFEYFFLRADPTDDIRIASHAWQLHRNYLLVSCDEFIAIRRRIFQYVCLVFRVAVCASRRTDNLIRPNMHTQIHTRTYVTRGQSNAHQTGSMWCGVRSIV